MNEAHSSQAAQRENTVRVEEDHQILDTLLVFGQGPILDKVSRQKASEAGTVPGDEDINFWSKTLAQAAAVLYQKGQTREIFLMGGRTGGPDYLSEADLIARELVEKCDIPEAVIKREKISTNTLENLVNMLNHFEIDKSSKVGALGADYHLPRIRVLMELLDIPVKVGFSAEAVLRAQAYETDDWWKSPDLDELDKRLDINAAGRTPVSSQDAKLGPQSFFAKQLGAEQKDVLIRAQEEDVWTRALLEKPEYWIMYLGRLNDADRIRTVLGKLNQGMLSERFAIDPAHDTDDKLRHKLSSIARVLPSFDEWFGQEWPEDTKIVYR